MSDDVTDAHIHTLDGEFWAGCRACYELSIAGHEPADDRQAALIEHTLDGQKLGTVYDPADVHPEGGE